MFFTLNEKIENYLAILLLALGALVLFLSSPTAGDFSWSDAPRHALNGVFVKDFIAAMPLSQPKQYAVNYYLQYPALTILFYPPLMYFIMAGFYALFGFSHTAAQASITVFYFLLGVGVYLLARRWLPLWQAFAAAVLLMGAPEIALWGRQVMLDIPAYAWLTISALFLLRYLDNGRPAPLYLTVIFLLYALYTKQMIIFAAAVFALAILMGRGPGVLRQWHIWSAMGLFTVCLLPLIYLTLEFGQVNLDSVAGARAEDLGRGHLGAWTYYLKQMPQQLGWATFLLGGGFIVGMALKPTWRLPKVDTVLLLAWLVLGYFFFSAIAVREPRHDLTALLPVALFAVLFLNRTLAPLGQRYATLAALFLAVATFSYTLAFKPVPYVQGYAAAAEAVLEQAPANSTVLFSGQRDGSFIFNIRAATSRHDISVLRADKILLRLAIERQRGFQDRGLTQQAIYDLLNRYGVHYVVAQPDFWTDIPSMAALQQLLQDNSRFEPVRRIKISANFPVLDRELVLYRNLGPVATVPEPLTLEMVGIGRSFSGTPQAPGKP